MIEVYHKVTPTFMDEDKCSFPEGYELVAKVDTEYVGEAFRLTNTIDRNWMENEKVEVVKAARSTSVGDVLVKDNKPHLCRGIGWWVKEDGEWKELG